MIEEIELFVFISRKLWDEISEDSDFVIKSHDGKVTLANLHLIGGVYGDDAAFTLNVNTEASYIYPYDNMLSDAVEQFIETIPSPWVVIEERGTHFTASIDFLFEVEEHEEYCTCHGCTEEREAAQDWEETKKSLRHV